MASGSAARPVKTAATKEALKRGFDHVYDFTGLSEDTAAPFFGSGPSPQPTKFFTEPLYECFKLVGGEVNHFAVRLAGSQSGNQRAIVALAAMLNFKVPQSKLGRWVLVQLGRYPRDKCLTEQGDYHPELAVQPMSAVDDVVTEYLRRAARGMACTGGAPSDKPGFALALPEDLQAAAAAGTPGFECWSPDETIARPAKIKLFRELEKRKQSAVALRSELETLAAAAGVAGSGSAPLHRAVPVRAARADGEERRQRREQGPAEASQQAGGDDGMSYEATVEEVADTGGSQGLEGVQGAVPSSTRVMRGRCEAALRLANAARQRLGTCGEQEATGVVVATPEQRACSLVERIAKLKLR